MTELIKKLEAATEGSRELDCEIYGELHPERKGWEYTGRDHPNEYWRSPDKSRCEVCYISEYTTSIDAKLPEENITIMVFKPFFLKFHAFDSDEFEGIGHTEPLARRIAAMKARGEE